MLTITVPVHNEEESVGAVVDAVRDALRDWRDEWELIFVDDGSGDDTAHAVASRMQEEPRIRLVRLARNYGQSVAMQAGFDHARGELIVSMDGDLQNDPRDIPALVAKLAEGYDLVAGYRERRQDRLITRRLPSWVGNMLIRWVTSVPIRDTGCTLKVFRRELLERLNLYSDLHRFIPALAVAVAGARIAELPVRHHPRRFGHAKYGISRVAKLLPDLLTLAMLVRSRERPLRMFAKAGFAAFAVALLASVLAMLSAVDRSDIGSVVVLTAFAACWLTLSGFLIMVGLIAETWLQSGPTNRTFGGVLLRGIGAP